MADRRRELVGIPGLGKLGSGNQIVQSYYVYRLKNGKTRVRSHDHKDWTNPPPAYRPIVQLTSNPESVIVDIDEQDVLLISHSIAKLAERTGIALPVQPIAAVLSMDPSTLDESIMVGLTAAPVNPKAMNWEIILLMMKWLTDFLQTERKMEGEQLEDMHEMCVEIIRYAYSDILFSINFGDDLAAWEIALGTLFKGTSVNGEYLRKSSHIIEKYEFKRQYLFPENFLKHNRMKWTWWR